MRWSEAVTLEFVKMYLKHECLWNPSHPGYRLKYQRNKAYVDICKEFKDLTTKSLTVGEVRVKIKNLRTTYVQQVHKILQKSNPDSIYEPSLIWFQEMDQCLKHIPNNRHLGSLTAQNTSDFDLSDQAWGAEELHVNNNDDDNPDPLISNSDDDFELQKYEKSFTPLKTETPSTLSSNINKLKTKKHRNRTDLLKNSFECPKEDEFDIYGKYIASQLREMDLQKALRLQLEIQSLVSEARILDVNN